VITLIVERIKMINHENMVWPKYDNKLPVTLNSEYYERARVCVNALDGIEDVDGFVKKMEVFVNQSDCGCITPTGTHEEDCDVAELISLFLTTKDGAE